MHGNINAPKVAQALGPIANCTGACVPLDLFGTPGSITPAMLDFIGFDQHDKSEQKIWGGIGQHFGQVVRSSAAARSASPPASNIAA